MDKTNKPFVVTSAPHIRSEDSTRGLMLDVLIALLPAAVISVYTFGPRAAVQIAVCALASVFFEWLYIKLMKRDPAVDDLSAAVTGVLLAFNLPVAAPLWLGVVGAAFAIVVVKQLYGGIGKNIFNPALAARVFLSLSWPAYMSAFTEPRAALPLFRTPGLGDAITSATAVSSASRVVDAVSSATPLGLLKAGALAGPDLLSMLLGQTAGCLGETSALALLAGGVYLVYRRVISLRIPLAYLATVAALAFLFPLGGLSRYDYVAFALTGGGLLLGAIYMATDYVSSPVTPAGQWIYGLGCGLLTVFIRAFGAFPEGVSYAILLMNALVWLIDGHFGPRRYGTGRRGGAPRFARLRRRLNIGKSVKTAGEAPKEVLS